MNTVKTLFCTVLLLLQTQVWAATPYGKPIRQVHTNEKIVLLSYDDGPSTPYTEELLNLLDKYKAKATFFVVGMNVERYPNIVKDIMNRGHDIGNHSLHHDKFKHKSVEFIKKDLEKTDALIRKQGYTKVIPFRAPFGQLSENESTALRELKKPHILFNFLPGDWENPPAEVIYERVMKQARPGFIIVLHDGWTGSNRKNTIKATEMIIKSLQAKGYRFVTATEYLQFDKNN